MRAAGMKSHEEVTKVPHEPVQHSHLLEDDLKWLCVQ